tara:strand:- start:9405 stop:9872 length:468 start_codon:yes stop_codon:yes gene_type:complete
MPWGAAVAAAGIGLNLGMGMKANKKAKEAAKEQAQLTLQRRKEEIRLKKRQATKELGLGRAAVYASNIQMSGSSKEYLDELDTENMREIAFAKRAAQMEYDAIRKGAQGAGGPLIAQAAGDALQLAASSYASYQANQPPAPTLEPATVQTKRWGT